MKFHKMNNKNNNQKKYNLNKLYNINYNLEIIEMKNIQILK